jgi:hypothetical protein
MSDKPRAAAQAALDWLQSTEVQSMEEYLQVIDGLKDALAEPAIKESLIVAEPVAKLFETLPVYDTPPAAQPEQWEKPSASFDAWWDSDYDDSANPFTEDSAAYWAWAGWRAAQRPWVGLTHEDMADTYNSTSGDVMMRLVGFARAIEAKLKDKNT